MGIRHGKAAMRAALMLALLRPEPTVADAPSPAYHAAWKRTLPMRRSRRQDRTRRAIGTIRMYPMPPALIVRHTPEMQEEVRAVLDLLRAAGR